LPPSGFEGDRKGAFSGPEEPSRDRTGQKLV
jgi:hypothetical protein